MAIASVVIAAVSGTTHATMAVKVTATTVAEITDAMAKSETTGIVSRD